jgi:hypothetical protein
MTIEEGVFYEGSPMLGPNYRARRGDRPGANLLPGVRIGVGAVVGAVVTRRCARDGRRLKAVSGADQVSKEY